LNKYHINEKNIEKCKSIGMVHMYSIAILEEIGGKITDGIEARLDFLTEGKAESFIITRSENPKIFRGRYDLIVITAEMAQNFSAWDLECSILFAPGQYASRVAGGVNTGCVVSYGMSGKDTVTISSINEDMAVLALQRELMTLDEKVLERQEIPVRYSGRTSSDRVMGIFGSLLLMGADFEKFKNLT